ncbi:MAG: hypothetical protein HOP13_19315 [Alphaproteobacteria bacterium]|nr:hypothetical protein [Alphaproteobacteria bacterium]
MMRNVLAVVAGFVVAAAVMMGCEFANSFLYPFPPGMDTNDLEAVRDFAAAMPLSALVLVAIGWTAGSFAGGFATTRIARTGSPALAQIMGLLLTAGGVFNAWMIQNPPWFFWGGLPVFFLFAMLGHHAAVGARR